jgi:hypothetical protein
MRLDYSDPESRMAISEGEENRYCSWKMLGNDVPL